MIEVVGIGLDGAAGLTQKVRQLVDRATLLVGSDRHLSYFPHHPAERLVLGDMLEVIEEIQQRLPKNEPIAILVSGDPLFFGLGRLLLANLPSSQLRFHPHLSSVQLAFNWIKVPWQDAVTISLHGRSVDELTKLLQQGVEKIAILTDSTNTPVAIARHYLALDLPSSYDFWICENLGDVEEKINHFVGVQVEKLVSLPEKTFAPLNVVILLRQEEPAVKFLNIDQLPVLGLPDRIFVTFSDRPGLMTKREIRLMVLGELALQEGQVVWDIGAGTGSVSVEIARLCPTSEVYAIEKTAMGINLIQQNSRRLQVPNVIPTYGVAPNILHQLPAPNRIFIGGSGGKIEDILDVCHQKLCSDGVVVLALATIEHLNCSLKWLNDRSWKYHLLQLQISRSTPVGDLTRFTPLNPVTIISATR